MSVPFSASNRIAGAKGRVIAGPGSSDGADLAVARRVIRAEIAGLERLADALDGAFQTAVDTCAAVRGRIIVAGVGKSGHIARKIAATLASEDAILVLSNSGETSELADVIAYSRRFKIPLVAITGGRRSTLSGAADVVLLLPRAEEACPMGLAPTTSTTMMMTLGDALALALLERKGFSSADFRVFHPGGRIGRRLLRVRDIMHRDEEIPLASPGARMSDVILVMTAKSFGCIGVCDAKRRLIGVITDG